MNTPYIVTQAWSVRHIVTRGFGTFISQDFGQGEIVELGNAHCGRILTVTADVSSEKNYEAHVLTTPGVSVER